MLVATRMLQGLGGAMMNPVGRLILLRSFPKDQLVTAMSYVSIPSLIGPTLGPILGGVITTYWSWRWIFYVNIPFGLLAILVASRTVENVRGPSRGRFDTRGFVICGLGLALIQALLETVGRGEVGLGVQLVLLAGGAAMLALYWRHARRTRNPVLDLRLFRIRTFRVGSLAGGISRLGINAPPFLIPLLLQVGFGLSPVQSGFITFATSLGAVAIRIISSVLLRAFGFDRLLIVNSFVCAAWIAGFATFGLHTPHWLIFLYVAGFGTVRSVQFNGVQMLSYSEMPAARLSASTSLGSVVQQLTMGLGVSVSAALLALLAGPGLTPSIADFRRVFVMIAALPLLALPGFFTLQPEDGAEVSGHHRAAARPAGGD
jgi:predicted MFS family arabinose efflux permease